MDQQAMIQRIDERMRQLGLNAKSLARAAGLAPTYFRDLRDGRSGNPRVQHLLQLATALGYTLGELVGDEPVGWRERQASYATPAALDAPEDDDRFAKVAEAVAAMLREEQAPADTGSIARMARVVWRDMLKLPPALPFADRLSLTLSERRSIVRRARGAMFEPSA